MSDAGSTTVTSATNYSTTGERPQMLFVLVDEWTGLVEALIKVSKGGDAS